MQTFIDAFPAAAKAQGISYYWFEGYDEPWKVRFNTITEEYEDHWVCDAVNGL